MKLKRIMMGICLIASIILFASGINILNHSNKSIPERNDDIYDYKQNEIYDGQYDIARIEKTGEEQKTANSEPVNILLLGLDDEEVRSDLIVLLNYSPSDGVVNILSVPRDTRIRARGHIEKINALVGMGGEKLAVKGIEQLTGLPVTYYITLNFAGFRKIIDKLDGVEFDVPINMDYEDPFQNLHIHLKKGYQLLDGNKAEQLVRYRKGNRNGEGYSDGDIGRNRMQQEFLKALLEQKFKLKYITKADDVFLILKKNMKTNIELSDINYHIRLLSNIKKAEIRNFTLPGEPAYFDNLWFFIYDKGKTRDLIYNNFFR